MQQTFIYLRGKPGVGKITIGRLLEDRLGWKLFWFHDLKNAVYGIVREHRIPRLMDEVTQPVIRYLLERGDSIVYVRPSPDAKTVEEVRKLAGLFPNCRFLVIRLEASYTTLLVRVENRVDPYRITNKEDLDAYLSEREVADIPGEIIVQTEDLTPEALTDRLIEIIGNA